MLIRVRPTDDSREVVHHQHDFQIYCEDFCWHCGDEEESSAEPDEQAMLTRETVIHNPQHTELHSIQGTPSDSAMEKEEQGIDINEKVFGNFEHRDKSLRRFT